MSRTASIIPKVTTTARRGRVALSTFARHASNTDALGSISARTHEPS